MNGDGVPKVLLVGGDAEEQLLLFRRSGDRVQLITEVDPVLALNRVGLEDFDLVVVDPDVDNLTIAELLLNLLRDMRVPYRVLQKGNGNGKKLTDSGRYRAMMLPQDRFVESVMASLQVPA